MGAYGAYSLEQVLALPLTIIRALCRRIEARNMRDLYWTTLGQRYAANAEGKDFKGFLNYLESGQDLEEASTESEGEFLTGSFEFRHE